MANIKITQIRSAVSRNSDQGRTLKALGLRRIRSTAEHEDRPEILGMINKVAHLVSVTGGPGGVAASISTDSPAPEAANPPNKKHHKATK